MKQLILIITLLVLSSYSGPKSVLVIGDSLSCYKPNGWVTLVSQHYDTPIVNLSQVGKNTDWMLNALRNELRLNHYDYSTVFIYGGINDIFGGRKVTDGVDNITQMVDLCNHYYIQPVVILGYDPNKININTNRDGEELNRKRYIKYQHILQNLHLVAKIIPVDTTITRDYSSDGIHVNGAAQRKFADWIVNHME